MLHCRIPMLELRTYFRHWHKDFSVITLKGERFSLSPSFVFDFFFSCALIFSSLFKLCELKIAKMERYGKIWKDIMRILILVKNNFCVDFRMAKLSQLCVDHELTHYNSWNYYIYIYIYTYISLPQYTKVLFFKIHFSMILKSMFNEVCFE